MQKLALRSRNVVFPDGVRPALLVIENGVFSKILDFDSTLDEIPIEDLGSLYMSPGIIDLNVDLSDEHITSLTRAAVSGGLTSILLPYPTEENAELYTDVVFYQRISDEVSPLCSSSIWAYKAHISSETKPGHLTCISNYYGKPLILFPELTCEVTESKHMDLDMSVLQEVSSESSCEEEEEDVFISQEESGAFRRTSLKSNIEIAPFEESEDTPKISRIRKQMSLYETRKGSMLMIKESILKKIRHSVQCTVGMFHIPVQDIPFMNSSDTSHDSFLHLINNFPVQMEISAIQYVEKLERSSRVHFTNVSTFQAIDYIHGLKKDFPYLTVDTSIPYIFFSESDIKPTDTRYKLKPPIREKKNQMLLIERVKNGLVDCVSSFHQNVPPHLKFIGDFKDAKDGISSIGLNLPALWTKLKSKNENSVDNHHAIQLIFRALSLAPANVIGLHMKGSIEIGKHADLVVWDPFSRSNANTSSFKYPDVSPFNEEQMWGIVQKTYLRGQLVFSEGRVSPKGTILTS